jgi:hypothetical protein
LSEVVGLVDGVLLGEASVGGVAVAGTEVHESGGGQVPAVEAERVLGDRTGGAGVLAVGAVGVGGLDRAGLHGRMPSLLVLVGWSRTSDKALRHLWTKRKQHLKSRLEAHSTADNHGRHKPGCHSHTQRDQEVPSYWSRKWIEDSDRQ